MRIVKEEWEVDSRLSETFGVTRSDLVGVVREVVGARADMVENDPPGTAGQFAYIHGTRNLRALFRSRAWENHSADNISLVRHPEQPLMVAYQSVDRACADFHPPRAISGKGAASERMIDEAQGCLFSAAEMGPVAGAIDAGLWHFCVSVEGDDVRAELSLSSGISGGNFSGFIERIFIVGKGEWDALRIGDRDEGDAVEFEPIVLRR